MRQERTAKDVAAGSKALAVIEGDPQPDYEAGRRGYDEIIARRSAEGTRDLAQMHPMPGQQVWLVNRTL